MALQILAILILSFQSIARCQDNYAILQLTLFENAEEEGLLCNDGTPSGYCYRQGNIISLTIIFILNLLFGL